MKTGTFDSGRSARSRWVHRFVRWLLGGLFLYAGAVKLSDPLAFAIQLEKYGLLPATWLDPVSWVLPIIEIFAGLATMLGFRGGAETVGLLLVVFLAALGYSWWSGLDVPCGCFTLEDEQHRYGIQLTIIRDLIMLAGAVFLHFRRDRTPLQ